MRKPEYSYEPKGSRWVVLKWEHSGNISTGDKVYEYSEREEARKECFRLNGWKYTEPVPMRCLDYKSNLRWDDMPGWLKYVVLVNINPCLGKEVKDEVGTLEVMREAIVNSIKMQRVRVPIKLEVREDEGRKVLFLARSGRVLISIYIR